MAEDEQRLIEEARRSLEETEELREEAAEEDASHSRAKPSEPDADTATEDD